MNYLLTPVDLRVVHVDRAPRVAPAPASGGQAAPLERRARVRTTLLVPPRR